MSSASAIEGFKQAPYWKLIQPLFGVVEIHKTPEAFLDSFAKVTRPIGIVFAAHFCISEVFNGGLLQFFWNSTGVLAPEALDGFKAMGMPKLAAVIDEAIKLLGGSYPRDRDERWDALLEASPLSEAELERIFRKTDNLYLAFEAATEMLPLMDMSRQCWLFASNENGDFGNAATQYLTELGFLPS